MTEIAVWVAGGVGLSIVLRAGALYSGTDRLAFMLIALIGAGLTLGIVELASRVRRALRFEREVSKLPKEPTEADVDATSPALRSVLRARIAGVPSASAPAPYAAYLLGLLVMIGLLGTFMGLFESLRGAREALGTSGDVAALRAALAAPMTGLSRAFGTSAAGVSASAMLGLALVVVRRSESRVAGAVAVYVAGPLSKLTVAHRTLDALEAIAKQGAALPFASEAITRGANAMSDVARDVGQALERTTSAVGDDLRNVARSVREDLQGASAASARAVAEAVSPRLESAVSRVIESTAAQTSSTIARFDAASEARIAREAAHSDALAKRVERAVESVVAAHHKESSELREAIARDAKAVVDTVVAGRELLAEAEADRARAIAATMTETSATIAAQLRETALGIGKSIESTVVATQSALDAHRLRATEDESARAARFELLLGRVDASADAIGVRLADTAGVIAENLGATITATEEALAAHRARAVEQDEERTRRLDAAILTIETRLTESAVGSMDRFDALLARVETTSGLLDSGVQAASRQLSEVLVDTATHMDQASAKAAEHLASYLEKLSGIRDELRADDDARADRIAAATESRLEDLARTVSTTLAASMEKVVASAQAAPEAAARVIEDAAERLRVEAEAKTERDTRLELLVERLDALATAIDARGAEHTDRVGDLAARLQETADRSAAALEKGSVELTSTAELFGASVDKYREASDKWLTGLSVMRAAAERAAQGDAQDMLAAYLEQTREVFDHTLQFQRQLFNELRRVSPPEFAPTRMLPTGTDAEAEE